MIRIPNKPKRTCGRITPAEKRYKVNQPIPCQLHVNNKELKGPCYFLQADYDCEKDILQSLVVKLFTFSRQANMTFQDHLLQNDGTIFLTISAGRNSVSGKWLITSHEHQPRKRSLNARIITIVLDGPPKKEFVKSETRKPNCGVKERHNDGRRDQ